MRTVFELNQGLTMKNFKRCTPPTKVKVHTDIPLIIPACGLPKYEHDCIGSCTLLGFPEHPHALPNREENLLFCMVSRCTALCRVFRTRKGQSTDISLERCLR
jgi:hypothetical protein